jgi:hypothetical protein
MFWGFDGNKNINDEFCDTSKYFDWVLCRHTILKNKDVPYIIFCKSDFINNHIETLKNINSEFILVTGASDMCIELSNRKLFNEVLQIPNIKFWYGENMINENPKIKSLTAGFGADYSKNIIENKLVKLNKNKINKIFCCWRGSTNDYKDYRERADVTKIQNKLFVQFNQLYTHEFWAMLDTYKFTLCPIGNGIDVAPKIIECLLFKSVPICKKNINIYRLYSKYPVLWIDDWKEIDEDLINNEGNKLYEILQNNNYIENFKIKNILSNIINGRNI